MVAGIRGYWGVALGAALLLAGCAGAPPPPEPLAPPPVVRRQPQELALERALSDFYGAPYRAGGRMPARNGPRPRTWQ